MTPVRIIGTDMLCSAYVLGYSSEALANSARTRRRVQPSACEDRGTPAAAAEAAAGLERRQTERVAPNSVTAAAPRVRGRVAPEP